MGWDESVVNESWLKNGGRFVYLDAPGIICAQAIAGFCLSIKPIRGFFAQSVSWPGSKSATYI
jgi:hypothetical protein